MDYYIPNSEVANVHRIKRRPLLEEWITQKRPQPVLQLFAEELILEVANWCLDPASLLNLSSTCKDFARVLRTSSVWLSHHWGRGYDIGVLTNKAARAASAAQPCYGLDGWGVLVKSAFDKAEFPDDSHMTQWDMGKPTPHMEIKNELDPDAIEKYQPRGERWMKVFYDILTEHQRWNLELYPWIHDEALQIRVKSRQGRYFQALLCACDLLIRMWMVPVAVVNTPFSFKFSWLSLDELPPHDERRTSLTSLTKTFLIAKKIMEIQPYTQTQRRLFPHPPFGPSIWEGPSGEIDPKGLGWIPKVMETWKDRVYVVGQFSIWYPNWHCPYNKLRLGPAVFRMCLDFHPDGQITGRGGDFGGRFNIVSGSYRKTFMELVKQYEQEDGEEPDVYHAQGHMTPWGVYGIWKRPHEPKKITGFWVMWHFEGAPVIHFREAFYHTNGRLTMCKQLPYKAEPGWFEEYERLRDTGRFIERRHGYWEDPPPAPEDVPLPEIDAFGL